MPKTIEKQSYEIMSHDLVPHHEVISEKEHKDLLEKYHVTPDQLPKIIDTDPVAKSIDAKPGSIIRIRRKSHTAKEAVAYRYVVESND